MRRRRLALPAPRRSTCSPGGALPGSRVCCAHGRVRAHGRAWRSRERGREGEVKGGTGVDSLGLLAPSEDPCLALPLARAHGGRRLSFPLSLSSVHSRCLPHRTAAARGCVPSFPSGCSVPFLGGGARPVPRRGKGSAPRRRPAAALSPWLPGARAGRSRRRARGRERARRRVGGPPSRVFHPRTLSGYLATAFRRVGLKTPRGGRLSVPGVGGAEGPVGSRRRPAAPADSRSSRGGGFGSPLLGARGARLRVPGSPVRRRSRAPCLSVPTRFPSVVSLVSLAGPRRTPLRSPRRLSGGGGWRGGLCRRQLSSERKNACTTLSGGSLGSCVDEERS